MTTNPTLILVTSCLCASGISSLLMAMLKPLMRLIYKTPQLVRTNLLQIVSLLGVLLLFALVWAGGLFLSRQFDVPTNVARVCIALSVFLPVGVNMVRLNIAQDRKRREAKSQKRF